MAVIVLASAASCGVTSSALALTLASPRPSLLAECDPKGGTLRAGFCRGRSLLGSGFTTWLRQSGSVPRRWPARSRLICGRWMSPGIACYWLG